MKLSSAKVSKESKGASPSHGGHHKNSLHLKHRSHHSILPLPPVDALEQWSSVTVDMYNSNNNNHNQQQQPQTSHTSTSRSSDYSAGGDGEPSGTGNKWASRLLKECARAISDKDSSKIHHLLWMLNELASPYGDCDQKLASYFLQALFCKATESGQRCFKTLTSVAEKSHSFDSARKLILKFQEVSPWTTFGHVAANGAILEALDGEPKLHIIDISNTLCTQWPTLLEALATRNDDTPHLKLTVVVTANIVRSVMKEISQRMEKFARLMGVPFEFNVISGLNHIGELTKEALGVLEDEAVAVNCIGALRRVDVGERAALIQMFRSLGPKVVTVVEEEADFSSTRHDFVKCFEECLRFYTLYFEMLDECFTATSNEKLMLERECSRSIVRVLACDNDQDKEGECERRERGSQWSERLKEVFSPVRFSDDVADDVKALLKRYKAGWALAQAHQNETGLYLTWKEEAVVWVSAWKP
ncbi:SHOOT GRAVITROPISM 7, ENDODERMAL-AMYLOPLAST LESS 1, SHORT ROOT [Hibiscus trionum]|uniref:SHOOT GRAVITROPISM 7, ENDODERMAL-AMYLOPLAST LESS 1, SHORT ROOT n=1 Tax=Hibiscus trionum TaxID=183268 RepID=A0A9W7IDA9_HIBTR|nr:SHOOT GRAVITROPISM 7, ENDODERMAL-AMYLOPLAST LESS 1, SHORT ROOT [Hibiscus trionum]